MTDLFVTGLHRSGTTLVEKLIAGHPAISILSQPFPYLLLEAKRDLFSRRDLAVPAFPLGDLFRETRYGPEELHASLAAFMPTRERLRALFAEMRDYAGQYTGFTTEQVEAAIAGARPPGLAQLVKQLWRALASKPEATVFGAKEVVAEEFIPAFVEADIHVVLVVRDPRDVVSSLNAGAGPTYAGRRKPTLANIRLWRKSVAFALRYADDPRVTVLRYEDVVRDPGTSLGPVFETLGLALRVDAVSLRDESGRPWLGNSSHGDRHGVSARSIGTYTRHLAADVVAFIEACCHPELRALGYVAEDPSRDAREIIATFVDPYASERPELADYLGDSARDAEIERLARLQQPQADDAEWFVFAETAEKLRHQ